MALGIAIGLLSIVMVLLRAFAMGGDIERLELLLQRRLLVGMLIMSWSKDKVEGVMTIGLRSQSYAIAFIIGVLYTIIMPYVEFGVSKVLHSGGEAFKDLGDFWYYYLC